MREPRGLFIDKVISSVIETILFALLPFIWWLATVKGEITFTQWAGIKKVEKGNRAGTVKMTVCTAMPFLLLSIFLFYMLKGTQTATAEFRGMGVKALPAVFVYAFFNTAFPEEILFRGFLLKRLKNQDSVKIRYRKYQAKQMKAGIVGNVQNLDNTSDAYMLLKEYREDYISKDRMDQK